MERADGAGGPTPDLDLDQVFDRVDERLAGGARRTSDVLARLEAHVARHAPGVELVAGGRMGKAAASMLAHLGAMRPL